MKNFFLLLFLFFAQFVAAQSLNGDEGVLNSTRTYKKVSGDTVRLRPSVVAKMEKEEKQRAKPEAKEAKSKAKTSKTAKSASKVSKAETKIGKTETKAAKPGQKTVKSETKSVEAKSEIVKPSAEVVKSTTPRVKKSPIDSVQYSSPKYVLGDRVIMRGDSGHDVLSVARILVKKLYLDEADIIYTPDGGAVYDGAMIKAVLLFQKFNDFYEDGIIGRELIKALRKRK